MSKNQGDFLTMFNKTTGFIQKLQSNMILSKSQFDLESASEKIFNLSIWLTEGCNSIQFNFADEVEIILNKLYGPEITREYNDCVDFICESINLENLETNSDAIIMSLQGINIVQQIEPVNSHVIIEELTGGSGQVTNSERKHLQELLLFALVFSVFGICGMFLLYQIILGNVTPTIGQTVYTIGTKYSKPKPYTIETEYDIYEFICSRVLASVALLFYSIILNLDIKENIEKTHGKLSFVKLLKLTFDEQNQVITYICNKISQISNNQPTQQIQQIQQTQTIKIPELETIKVKPKEKLSLINPDIFIENKNFGAPSQAVKLNNWKKNKIKAIREQSQQKLNELKEVKEQNRFFKMISKVVPSIIKKIAKSKNKTK